MQDLNSTPKLMLRNKCLRKLTVAQVVHHHVHSSPQQERILSPNSPGHIFTYCSFNINFDIILHSTPFPVHHTRCNIPEDSSPWDLKSQRSDKNLKGSEPYSEGTHHSLFEDSTPAFMERVWGRARNPSLGWPMTDFNRITPNTSVHVSAAPVYMVDRQDVKVLLKVTSCTLWVWSCFGLCVRLWT